MRNETFKRFTDGSTGSARPASMPPLVTWGTGECSLHEMASHDVLSRRLAALLGREHQGRLEEWKVSSNSPSTIFCVPRSTLCGTELSRYLPDAREEDFFGGWVPRHIMSTKAIAHPLWRGCEVPDWSPSFAAAVERITLAGFVVNKADAAMAAGKALLRLGPVRVKAVEARGGNNQHRAATSGELEEVVARFCAGTGHMEELLVMEEDLQNTQTYSVGQVRVGGTMASYVGVQETTRDGTGANVYGGSRLTIVRGGIRPLLAMVPEEIRVVVRLACRFDILADRHLELVASRRNYDVIRGVDGGGRERFAVLEQSWRAGGASGAEVAALEIFAKEPEAAVVRAATVERYGTGLSAPAGATTYFAGTDPLAGPMLKYAIIEAIES